MKMDEYINKHEAYTMMKDLEAAYIYPPVKEAYGTAARRIDQMPTADVQPIDRWIDAQKNPPPIIDRRSMTSKSVLILRDNGRCSVAYYCNSAEDGDYWTTDDDKTMYCWEEVTHWQPLPELPKGEEVKIAEPKPCPFCGGKAVNCMKQYDGRIYRYRIQCDNAGCACRTPWLCYQEDAIEVWNRRAVK